MLHHLPEEVAGRGTGYRNHRRFRRAHLLSDALQNVANRLRRKRQMAVLLAVFDSGFDCLFE